MKGGGNHVTCGGRSSSAAGDMPVTDELLALAADASHPFFAGRRNGQNNIDLLSAIAAVLSLVLGLSPGAHVCLRFCFLCHDGSSFQSYGYHETF